MALPADTSGLLLLVLMNRHVTPCCTCPCVAGSLGSNYIPSFASQNYFCESGITQLNSGRLFWPDGDPLWDGQGCGPTSSCCTFNSPPWFNVTLPSPSTDHIEVRICSGHGGIQVEDTPIQLMELYVKWMDMVDTVNNNIESVEFVDSVNISLLELYHPLLERYHPLTRAVSSPY